MSTLKKLMKIPRSRLPAANFCIVFLTRNTETRATGFRRQHSFISFDISSKSYARAQNVENQLKAKNYRIFDLNLQDLNSNDLANIDMATMGPKIANNNFSKLLRSSFKRVISAEKV
uniref:Uncharacterized protein n=1 Tax=Glossina austeni TaxID=7395 RepID=A0A1A9VCB6_GLOAU